MRLESGSTQRPRPALLARIAEASGHELALFLDEDDEEGDRPMRVVVPLTFEITEDQLDRALQRALTSRLEKSNAPPAPIAKSADEASTTGGYTHDRDPND